jgi:carbamoyl-phosphate synthase small subunit
LKATFAPGGGHTFQGVCDVGQSGTYEIVFNTSMTGSTELITDPACLGQAVLLTYPLIGNSGVCFEDFQSEKPQVAALIVSHLSEIQSNFRSEYSLKAVLERHNIPLISGVDTRSLVRLFRHLSVDSGRLTVDSGRWTIDSGPLSAPPPRYQGGRRSVKAEGAFASLAVPDTGLRRDLERAFVSQGISLEIFPQGEAVTGDFDGYLLPGGPGDPSGYDLSVVKDILAAGKPIFAAGLGHQLLALAQGAKTSRLFPGHRGQNIPVRNLKTGAAVITTQNHGYAVDASAKDLPVSHVNVNDGTVEGIRWREDIISVQFKPETELISEFIEILR